MTLVGAVEMLLREACAVDDGADHDRAETSGRGLQVRTKCLVAVPQAVVRPYLERVMLLILPGEKRFEAVVRPDGDVDLNPASFVVVAKAQARADGRERRFSRR